MERETIQAPAGRGRDGAAGGTRGTGQRLSRRALLGFAPPPMPLRAASGGLRALTTVAAPLALALTAACGPGTGARWAAGAGANPTATARTPARVRFLIRADAQTQRLVAEQVRAFGAEAQGPPVRVEVEPAADWLGTFRSLGAAGTAPEAALFAHDAAGAAVREGRLENLEPYLSRQRDFREGDFERGAWHAAQYEGKRWGLPWEGGAYALVFNADLFQAANVPLPDPKKRMTWDDLLGIARRLTVDAEGKRPADAGFDPRTTQVYGFAANSSWGLATFIMSSGGELLTADGKVPVDAPEALEALQFAADLRLKHHVAPETHASTPAGASAAPATPGASGSAVAFERGNLAMAYEGAWCLRRFNDAGVRWGAVPAPLRRVHVSGGHFSPVVMTRGAQEKDATWSWLAFAALSESGQRLAVDSGQTQPARRSLESRFVGAETAPTAPYRQAFSDELKGGTLRVAGDRSGSYWGGHQREWARLWQVLLQPLLRGEKGTMPVAADLRRHTELLLKLGRPPIQLPP